MKVEYLLKRDKSFENAMKRMEENLVKGGKENTVFPLPDPEIHLPILVGLGIFRGAPLGRVARGGRQKTAFGAG